MPLDLSADEIRQRLIRSPSPWCVACGAWPKRYNGGRLQSLCAGCHADNMARVRAEKKRKDEARDEALRVREEALHSLEEMNAGADRILKKLKETSCTAPR